MINEKKTFTIFTRVINVLSWIIALISLEIVDIARPPFETFFNRVKNMPLRKTWDLDTLQYAFYFLPLLLLLSIFSIVLNVIAYKKENYSLKFSPFFLSLFALIGITIYFIYF